VPALLLGLAALLAVSWTFADRLPAAAITVVAVGFLAFAVIPGMQARVFAAAAAAPTLAMAVNASGYQVAAALAGWSGGLIVDSAAGPRLLYPVAAAITGVGVLLAAVFRPGRERGEPQHRDDQVTGSEPGGARSRPIAR
jgi:DHA1 family inner membrane transport protein